MKLKIKISLILLFLLSIPCIYSQDDTQPLSPFLDKVTVDPYSGFATLNWVLSSSPDVASYVIYTYSGTSATAVDTVRSPYATSYTHTGSAARYKSVSYVVAAMDSSLNISPLSNILSTIYLNTVNDTCYHTIGITWTGYDNTLYPVTGYNLTLILNDDPPVEITGISSDVSSYTYNANKPSVIVCTYISAVSNGTEISKSDMQCNVSSSELTPAWVLLNSLSVVDRQLILSGSYDQLTDIKEFAAEIYDTGSGSWRRLQSVTGEGGILYATPEGCDTTLIALYRFSAITNCNTLIRSSVPSENIVLTAVREGNNILLRWNNPLTQGESEYHIMRDTGTGWKEVAGPLTDTTWNELYQNAAEGISSAAIAYYVDAWPVGTSGISGVYRSSTAVVTAEENVFVPNAFTPDDNGLNDTFIPVLSFIPSEFGLDIFTRNGVHIWHTADSGSGWDGKVNGKKMAAGVYLWNLRLVTPSGKIISRRGTVTILP